jgi:hypothetical protein
MRTSVLHFLFEQLIDFPFIIVFFRPPPSPQSSCCNVETEAGELLWWCPQIYGKDSALLWWAEGGGGRFYFAKLRNLYHISGVLKVLRSTFYISLVVDSGWVRNV